MFVDIMMALIIALFLEGCSLYSKGLKQLIILVSCIAIIFIYFIFGCQFNFVGIIDFGVWIMFVILFNKLIMLGINKLSKHIKE